MIEYVVIFLGCVKIIELSYLLISKSNLKFKIFVSNFRKKYTSSTNSDSNTDSSNSR